MRFVNDVKDIFDTYFGFMGVSAPNEREIAEGDYLLLGTAQDQDSAENICKKLNELEEKNAELLIKYIQEQIHVNEKEISKILD